MLYVFMQRLFTDSSRKMFHTSVNCIIITLDYSLGVLYNRSEPPFQNVMKD